MDLEFLLRRTPVWRDIAERILFQPGDIVEAAEEAEQSVLHGDGGGEPAPLDAHQSLGIGSLRGDDS
jgi:hypothetical protein